MSDIEFTPEQIRQLFGTPEPMESKQAPQAEATDDQTNREFIRELFTETD